MSVFWENRKDVCCEFKFTAVATIAEQYIGEYLACLEDCCAYMLYAYWLIQCSLRLFQWAVVVAPFTKGETEAQRLR